MSVQIVKLLGSPVQLVFTGGITPKGAYSAGTTYSTGESVSYNGSSYVAIQETAGNLPTNTTYWQVISNKGETGATGSEGPQGPQGNAGAPGADGADGAAATIAVGDVIGGETASVTNVGTNNAAVFDFVLPQGETGPQGPKGDPGSGVTSQATGFTITAGTTPKTLTVASDANVSGTNTGDQTLPVKASAEEVTAGTDDAKFITSKALKDAGGAGGASVLVVQVFS